MPLLHGADPSYGNVHQQLDASQPNHPTTPHTSIYMQQSPTNSPHHKVRPAQSAELQLSCPIQLTPQLSTALPTTIVSIQLPPPPNHHCIQSICCPCKPEKATRSKNTLILTTLYPPMDGNTSTRPKN